MTRLLLHCAATLLLTAFAATQDAVTAYTNANILPGGQPAALRAEGPGSGADDASGRSRQPESSVSGFGGSHPSPRDRSSQRGCRGSSACSGTRGR